MVVTRKRKSFKRRLPRQKRQQRLTATRRRGRLISRRKYGGITKKQQAQEILRNGFIGALEGFKSIGRSVGKFNKSVKRRFVDFVDAHDPTNKPKPTYPEIEKIAPPKDGYYTDNRGHETDLHLNLIDEWNKSQKKKGQKKSPDYRSYQSEPAPEPVPVTYEEELFQHDSTKPGPFTQWGKAKDPLDGKAYYYILDNPSIVQWDPPTKDEGFLYKPALPPKPKNFYAALPHPKAFYKR
jgi:hypothetical protein